MPDNSDKHCARDHVIYLGKQYSLPSHLTASGQRFVSPEKWLYALGYSYVDGAGMTNPVARYAAAKFAVLVSLLCGIVMFSSGLFAQEVADTASEPSREAVYKLAPGDSVQISVLGQDDLSIEARLSATGTIIYPLLGELTLAGLSREQVEELVYTSLKGPYLVAPVVSVTILSYRQIFLQGEVVRPGPYAYAPGLTLRRAILNAGGFTDLAAKGKIFVINENAKQDEERREAMDYQVQPGDIITVKASFF